MTFLPGKRPARTFSEALTRILRHEVGDLLQSVYATVAILQKRLPPEMELERRLLADLRTRAEGCRDLLDAVHDYACPLLLSPEPVDPGEVAEKLVAEAKARFGQLSVRAQVERGPTIQADVRRLEQLGRAILRNACESARQNVLFQSSPGPRGGVTWTISDDGPGLPPEELARIGTPFRNTQHGHIGLGIALARKLLLLHGGEFTAANRPEGGLRVQMRLPSNPPAEVPFQPESWFSAGV